MQNVDLERFIYKLTVYKLESQMMESSLEFVYHTISIELVPMILLNLLLFHQYHLFTLSQHFSSNNFTSYMEILTFVPWLNSLCFFLFCTFLLIIQSKLITFFLSLPYPSITSLVFLFFSICSHVLILAIPSSSGSRYGAAACTPVLPARYSRCCWHHCTASLSVILIEMWRWAILGGGE